MDKSIGVLLYTLASGSIELDRLSSVVGFIQNGKINSVQQLNGKILNFNSLLEGILARQIFQSFSKLSSLNLFFWCHSQGFNSATL